MRSFSYEEEFAVIQPYDKEVLKDKDEPISMNVGIKDLLSILIELNHINYSIHGTLKGTVTFGKVNLMLTKMEIQLIKKEKIYGYNNKTQKNISEKIVATYELIDGGPYKNETIPFRLFLSPYNLTPTYIDIASYFSSRYFLNLVIKDQENNKYFKQKEIFLFRLYINPINEMKKNNIEHLKNFITEPIDYGDYFSSFNDIEEKEEKNLNNFKEPEPSEFYFRSNLKGFIEDNNDQEKEKEENDEFKINIKNRSNSVFIINKNTNFLDENDDNDIPINIINNNYVDDDNLVIENKNKSSSVSKKKNNKKQNKVINIKEKNKYKNNDILINDNYYNADNYIIYENSYNNIFDNKLKTNRIKENLKENKNVNNNINNKEKNSDDLIININNDINNINNEIDDQKLFFPDEPFSNSLILNNLPSNYGSIRDDDNDFRKNLMGQRIKKEK